MPYYLYRITEQPVRLLTKIAEFGAFKEASTEAKRLRVEDPPPAGSIIKVMFAENELLAEDLLSQPREPEPMIGDDY
jgi:hypothetical protein